MRYYCNPINVPYAYQFKKDPRDKYQLTVNREAADPSMVEYHGKYYLFASMSGYVWRRYGKRIYSSVGKP